MKSSTSWPYAADTLPKRNRGSERPCRQNEEERELGKKKERGTRVTHRILSCRSTHNRPCCNTTDDNILEDMPYVVLRVGEFNYRERSLGHSSSVQTLRSDSLISASIDYYRIVMPPLDAIYQ